MTERRGDTAGFDPRFDPAFQPGYRPPAVKPDGLEALTAAAVRQASPPGPRIRKDTDAAARDTSATGTTDITAESAESADEQQRRNPFMLALWALSALITLGGIGMVRWSFTLTEELQSSTASQADYQLSYMIQQSGPLFVVLGLGVAAMTVFLHAQAWNRRRG